MPAPRGNSWSSPGPIRKVPPRARRAAAGHTTIRKGTLSMPAAPAPASSRRSSGGCDAACSRWPPPRCRSRCCRRTPAASDRRSSSAAFTGRAPSRSQRSNTSPGPRTDLTPHQKQIELHTLRGDRRFESRFRRLSRFSPVRPAALLQLGHVDTVGRWSRYDPRCRGCRMCSPHRVVPGLQSPGRTRSLGPQTSLV